MSISKTTFTKSPDLDYNYMGHLQQSFLRSVIAKKKKDFLTVSEEW